MRPTSSIPAAVLLAALLMIPASSRACSCTNNLTLQEEYDNATGVFAGRVLSIQPSGLGDGKLVVFLEPLIRWKGPLDYTQLLITPENPAICGYPFEVGTDYLVFYSMVGYGLTYTPTPFTHLCSRTSPLEGNTFVPLLPAPQVTTAAPGRTWGSLKIRYR
jgi:hypothetical protein